MRPSRRRLLSPRRSGTSCTTSRAAPEWRAPLARASRRNSRAAVSGARGAPRPRSTALSHASSTAAGADEVFVGRIREDLVQVDLQKTLPEIIDLLSPPSSIEIKVTNRLPTVVFEKTRIEQVFQNLLSNAIKYMDKPCGHIAVGCLAENGCWKFSVADDGPGIEEKHFGKIFQIFQTLAPRDQVESTGIGLTLVKKIVEMYGGSIWVESQVGKGSTFYFTLPREKTGILN